VRDKSREPDDFLTFVDGWQKQEDQLLGNTERFEAVEGGWDYEHCNVCSQRFEADEPVQQVGLPVSAS
jgi:hypothetical protein